MQFINAVPSFIKESVNTQQDLERYFAAEPAIFDKYFPMHCPKTDERLHQALEKYPGAMARILTIQEQFAGILHQIEHRLSEKYQIHFPNKAHLFVGTYGSNAFVTHEIIGNVYFAAEKLSPVKEHLEVIVAHELGHVTHHLLSDLERMDWRTVDWWHPFGWLYREGVATFISKQAVEAKQESTYYTYDDAGDEWLAFAISKEAELKSAFLEAYKKGWTDGDSREWFKLRGGKQFAFERLAYYLGTRLVEDLAAEVGDLKAITFWSRQDIIQRTARWLAS